MIPVLSRRPAAETPSARALHLHILAFILPVWIVMSAVYTAQAAQQESRDAPSRPWSVSLQTRYFFSSHTSYEFGNPYPPYQTPLSRLEFPLDSWWAGASVRRKLSRFSVGMELFHNISGEAKGVFKDSDWDDDHQPQVKTIYSESSCRMQPSYIVQGDVDMKVADWLGLSAWFDLRPVVGLRWQRLSLVTHDGLQSYPADGGAVPPVPLPGDGINFEQTYWQPFAGLRAGFDMGRPFRLARLNLDLQLDWAYVYGYNEDHHLLHRGRRLTRDKTRGDAWHALVNLKIGLTQGLNANIGAEYLRISTTGTHQLLNEPLGIDFSFERGVKAWSEQISMTLGLEYTF